MTEHGASGTTGGGVTPEYAKADILRASKVFDDVAAELLTRPGVSIGTVLQNDALKIGGKVFAFVKDDRLVVKLPTARVATLRDNGGGVPFRSGGRTMREWVAVP